MAAYLSYIPDMNSGSTGVMKSNSFQQKRCDRYRSTTILPYNTYSLVESKNAKVNQRNQ